MPFLPVNRSDMAAAGWDALDFLFITGDAYIDHPSFGPAILSRLLEAKGYRVGILPRPSIDDPDSVRQMGRPRYGVLISPGVVDSMVNNYTASLKPRRHDRYAPEQDTGRRPDRAVIAYANLVRSAFGDIPLIIGGIESSLRRFAHYDYWSHKVRRSVLQDTQADILSYGMGERTIPIICDFLARGVPVRSLTTLRGTCVLTSENRMSIRQRAFAERYAAWSFDTERDAAVRAIKDGELSPPTGGSVRAEYRLPQDDAFMLLPSFESVRDDPVAYCAAFWAAYTEQDPKTGRTLFQRHGHRWLIQNPPDAPLSVRELDRIYELPYERCPHPMYSGQGRLPAVEEVRFSIQAHRGCFGGCHFCAITFHQGRIIQPRSNRSVLREAKTIAAQADFKGYIHDVGGPTANFHLPACPRQSAGSCCKDRQCLSPAPCSKQDIAGNQKRYFELLEQVRAVPGIKKAFVRSGIRFDYLMMDRTDYLPVLCEHHISGQLKVAPEHVSQNVLAYMGKPGAQVYRAFSERYRGYNERIGKRQYLVPYLMSSHPGCTLDDAIELACHIKANRVMPEQVQDFYPTPGTVSTTMYHTGLDPFTLRPVHIPKGREKQMQRALMQFGRPEHRTLVLEALRQRGRTDLIGYGPVCLVPPAQADRRTPAGRTASGRKPHRQPEQSRTSVQRSAVNRTADHKPKKRAAPARPGPNTSRTRTGNRLFQTDQPSAGRARRGASPKRRTI